MGEAGDRGHRADRGVQRQPLFLDQPAFPGNHAPSFLQVSRSPMCSSPRGNLTSTPSTQLN